MTALGGLISATGVTPSPGDAYDPYCVLNLKTNLTNAAQNNTFLDSSSNNFTITRNGNTTQGSFSPFSKEEGKWGVAFDGSGDSVSGPSNTAFDFGTGDFTQELFVFHNQLKDYSGLIGMAVGSIPGNGTNLFIFANGSIGATFDGVGDDATSSAGVMVVGRWQHVAYQRSGNNFSIYVDGVSVATGTTTNPSTLYGSLNTWAIGATQGTVGLNGYVSNVRVIKGQALFSGSFTPPTSNLTTSSVGSSGSGAAASITGTVSLLTCQSNRFIDNSTNAFTLTRNGDVKVSNFSPFKRYVPWSAATNGGSGYFDGTGDYLDASTNTAFQIGSGDFCIEFWVFPITFPAASNYHTYFTTRVGGNGMDIQIYNSAGTYQLMFGNNAAAIIQANSVLTLNAWNYVVGCRSGTNMSLYVNGTRVANGTSSNNFSDNGAKVGCGVGGGNTANAHISNVRLVKGSYVYDPASSTLTVPTSPLTAITNTSLLFNFTNADIYDATGKNCIETAGNAQVSTGTKKFVASAAFDGTGDWLAMPANQDFAFSTGDFTIEFWFNPSSVAATTKVLLDFRGTADGVYPMLYENTGVLYYHVSSATRISGGSLSVGTWYHVAICRSGTSTKMFVGGSQVGSTYSDSNSYLIDTGAPFIGKSYDNYYANGNIEDLRITKGVARYTSSFTPPVRLSSSATGELPSGMFTMGDVYDIGRAA